MKTDLIKTLNNTGLDLTGQEIADILWLAPHLDKPALQENKEPDASIPKSDFEQPEFQDKDTEPSPEQPRAEVFQPEPETKELTGPGIGGIPFRSPAAPALPGELSIRRALRPLMRKVPSRSRFVLDEEATVRGIAETDNWIPVMKPEPSRWLDIVIVVDECLQW